MLQTLSQMGLGAGSPAPSRPGSQPPLFGVHGLSPSPGLGAHPFEGMQIQSLLSNMLLLLHKLMVFGTDQRLCVSGNGCRGRNHEKRICVCCSRCRHHTNSSLPQPAKRSYIKPCSKSIKFVECPSALIGWQLPSVWEFCSSEWIGFRGEHSVGKHHGISSSLSSSLPGSFAPATAAGQQFFDGTAQRQCG